ncbi:MAG: GNAT family N-acetyltransferase [Janthinobacterium lividum]
MAVRGSRRTRDPAGSGVLSISLRGRRGAVALVRADAALAEHIEDSGIEIWVLTADGQPAGFAEIDRRNASDVELSYFGLLPAFIGRGLGGKLLRSAVREAWTPGTRRFWVHTCDLDHPSALALYRRCGFAPFRIDVMDEPDLRLSGEFPPDAARHRPLARS